MSEMSLVHTRTKNGIWEGFLKADTGARPAPDLSVTLNDMPVTDIELTEVEDQKGAWSLRFAIPTAALTDGVQTVLVSDGAGARLASYCIIAGCTPDEDPQVELALLRAELDMLKQAFRRHCRETGGD